MKTIATPAPVADPAVQAIAAKLLSGSSAPGRTLAQWAADRVADSGSSLATLGAGFAACTQNVGVVYATERARQAQRTAEKTLALAARLSQAGITADML
jgi:hypothetical protein